MENNQQIIESDEISLKDLILLVQKYISILLKNWIIIGVCTALMGGLFLYKSLSKKIQYTANLTYTSGEGSGLAGLAGGFVGQFLGKGKTNPLVKIQSLAKSEVIGRRVLFQKAFIDGKLDYLINHHARLYEWEEFIPFQSAEMKTIEERETFKNLHGTLNKALLAQGLDEESGIANLAITTVSEDYSIALTNAFYTELIRFNKETETGEQQRTLKALQNRADSIYQAIESTAYRVAKIKDSDKGIFWSVDKIPEAQATTELTFLTSIYQEVVKNLETIKFSVATSAPSVQVIDYPLTPLEDNKGGTIKQIIIGCFIGGFLSSLFILGRAIYREIMEDEDTENAEIPES